MELFYGTSSVTQSKNFLVEEQSTIVPVAGGDPHWATVRDNSGPGHQTSAAVAVAATAAAAVGAWEATAGCSAASVAGGAGVAAERHALLVCSAATPLQHAAA